MKKTISLLFILLLLLATRGDCAQVKDMSGTQLISVLKAENLQIFSCSISSYGHIYKTQNVSSLEKEVKDVADFFDVLPESAYTTTDFSDSMRQVMLRGQCRNGSLLTVRFDSLSEKDGSSKNYLTVDVYCNGQADIEYLTAEIKDLFELYRSIPRIYTCIIGSSAGRTSGEESRRMEGRVMNSFNAYTVYSIRNSTAVSVFAYSPSISRYSEYKGSLINVNFSSIYNSQEDKTYVYLASPMINKH